MAEWKVRIADQEYPARDREMVKEWLRAGRLTPGSTIFDGEQWLSLPQFAGQDAPAVIVTTTPSLEGYRITRYLAIETAGEGILTLRDFTAHIDDLRMKVLWTLRLRAVLHGGNAVVGVTFDYIWAGELVPTLTAAGTVVLVEPLQR